jgi:Tat protein secretion system quality control protein TatD with DNase activity
MSRQLVKKNPYGAHLKISCDCELLLFINSRDYASKICDILDEMGRASAIAQGLQKAVTSGERLRNSEHTVYLLTDPEGKR